MLYIYSTNTIPFVRIVATFLVLGKGYDLFFFASLPFVPLSEVTPSECKVNVSWLGIVGYFGDGRSGWMHGSNVFLSCQKSKILVSFQNQDVSWISLNY